MFLNVNMHLGAAVGVPEVGGAWSTYINGHIYASL